MKIVYCSLGFRSTRSTPNCPGFLDIARLGLAKDRGLYVPTDDVPRLTIGQWDRMVNQSYSQVAMQVMEQWIPAKENLSRKVRNRVIIIGFLRLLLLVLRE